MKQNTNPFTASRINLLLPAAAVLLLLLTAACGRSPATPTPEPVAAAAQEDSASDESTEDESAEADSPSQDAEAAEPTEEPTEEPAEESTDAVDQEAVDSDADAQPESPLSQPESPLAQPESPLSQPESPLAGPEDYPPPVYTMDVEPGDDTGVVIGKLIAPTPSSLVLFAGDIYLGRSDPTVLEKDGETIEVEFLDLVVNEDPKASLRTPEGEFAVVDVPPGRYGLVIWTPVDSYVLPSDDEEGNFAFFDVEAGEVVDLGNVVIRR